MACLPCLALLAGLDDMGCSCGCNKCGDKKSMSGVDPEDPLYSQMPGLVQFPNISASRGSAWTNRLAGMSGMGDLDQAGAVDWLTSIINGSTYDAMFELQTKLSNQRSDAQMFLNQANSLGDPTAINAANNAINAANNGISSFNQAKDIYNQIVSTIQTYSFNQVRPSQLGDVTGTLITQLVGLGAVYSALNSLSMLFGSAQQSSAQAGSFLDEVRRAISAIGQSAKDAGDAVESIANSILKMAALGVGGFFLYKYAIKKKGVA
jgi:hypothetical protein